MLQVMNATDDEVIFGLRSHTHRRFSIWLVNFALGRLYGYSLTNANQEKREDGWKDE